MGINNASLNRGGPFLYGVDDTTELDTKETPYTLSSALNTDLVDETLLKKRNGYLPINTSAWSTRRIRQGFEYKKTNGTREVLLYGESSALTGTSGILGRAAGTAAPTTIVSNLKDGIKPSILQFKSLAFVFNGLNDFLYDGTTTRQIGITEPNVAPIYQSATSGELVGGGSYFWAYRYYNSQTGARSSLSPPSESVIIDSTNTGAIISVTPGDSTTADIIQVFRVTSGGSILFLDGETTISATSYSSTVSDAGLGVEAELDDSRPVGPAKYAISSSENRIFLAGFTDNKSRVHYSKIGIDGPLPESYQAADFCDCNLNDGDEIIGLGLAGDSVIVLKTKSVGRLISISSIGGGLEREGTQKYIYQEISNEITGLSHHLMVSVNGVCIWMGRDDIYGTDGSQIFRFGKRVRKTLKTINFQQAHKFSVVNKSDTQQLIFSVCRSGQSEPDFQFVGHYRNYPIIAFTYYSPGTNTTTHPGLRAASLFQVVVDGQNKIWFGSSDAVGTFYQMDRSSGDNTNGIYWDVKGPWDSQNRPNFLKKYHSYLFFAVGTGVAPNNTLSLTFERDKTETAVATQTATISTALVNWNEGNWNEFSWNSATFRQIRFHPNKKAYYGRVGFSNTYAAQPVAIQALTSRIISYDKI